MSLEWTNFPDDGQIIGMEAFVSDDIALDIIKYANGVGFHWLIRRWNDNGCEVQASYDVAGYEDGYAMLSDAYQDLISVAEEDDAIAPYIRKVATTSGVLSFLRRAVQLGLAATLTFGTMLSLVGCGGPSEYVKAWEEGSGASVIEFADGNIYHMDDAFYNTPDGLAYQLSNESTKLTQYDITNEDDPKYLAIRDILSYGEYTVELGNVYLLWEQGSWGISTDHLLMLTDTGHAYRLYNTNLIEAFADVFGTTRDRIIQVSGWEIGTDSEESQELLEMIPRWEDPSAELMNKWTFVKANLQKQQDEAAATGIMIGMMAGRMMTK